MDKVAKYIKKKGIQMSLGTISGSLVRKWFKVQNRHGLSCMICNRSMNMNVTQKGPFYMNRSAAEQNM